MVNFRLSWQDPLAVINLAEHKDRLMDVKDQISTTLVKLREMPKALESARGPHRTLHRGKDSRPAPPDCTISGTSR